MARRASSGRQSAGGGKKRRSTSARKTNSKGRVKAQRRSKSAAPSFLTAARQRELGGAALLALGVITLVSFVSQSGSLTLWWQDTLRLLFGRGAYLIPILMGSMGAWLIIDSMDDEVDVRWMRPLGAVALFLCVLSAGHLLLAATADYPEAWTYRDSSQYLAQQRAGGGYAGYLITRMLYGALGLVPSLVAIAIAATLSLSFIAGLTLNQSAERFFGFLRGGTSRLWKDRGRPALWWRERQERKQLADANPLAEMEPVPDTVGSAGPAATRGAAKKSEQSARDAGRQASTAKAPATAGTAKTSPRPQLVWQLPSIEGLLEPAPELEHRPDESEAMAATIEQTLDEFGIPVEVVNINVGPTITQFGLKPGYIEKNGRRMRVAVRRILALQNDLALALAASPVRILAPVPGRPYVGVEVPNVNKSVVSLRGVMDTEAFRRVAKSGGLPVALGRDTNGQDAAADLARMPHLLVAGATGAGKSVCINALISSLLLTHTPATLKMVLVDPKRVEMSQYRGLPHLATPVIVEAERVVGVLQWAVREMDRRYKRFAELKVRNLQGYNERQRRHEQPPMPYLVIVIDELADLMMLAPEESERLITRLAQLARATGIHLVLATQRPSVDVVTGLIKANFPSRIAFAVSSSMDSRVILDSVGAEKLLGQGDMLYQGSDDSKLRRMQGCYVSDDEIESLTRYWKDAAREALRSPSAAPGSLEIIEEEAMAGSDPNAPADEDANTEAGAVAKDTDSSANGSTNSSLADAVQTGIQGKPVQVGLGIGSDTGSQAHNHKASDNHPASGNSQASNSPTSKNPAEEFIDPSTQATGPLVMPSSSEQDPNRRITGSPGKIIRIPRGQVSRHVDPDPDANYAETSGPAPIDDAPDPADADQDLVADTRMTLGIPDPMIRAELWDQMVDPDKGALSKPRDALWDDALALIREHSAASTSFLQRKLRIGYSRAARIIDEMEDAGLIGPPRGNLPREVLIDSDADLDAADDYRTSLDKSFGSNEPPPKNAPLEALELPLDGFENEEYASDVSDAGSRSDVDKASGAGQGGLSSGSGSGSGPDSNSDSTPDEPQDDLSIRPWMED